jgi:hypothetical protein
MQMANQKAVIRRNFFYRNPAYGLGIYRGGASTEEARFLNDNHIYQNTFYKNLQVSPPPVVSDAAIKFAVGCGVPLAGNTQNNVIKNNIIYNNGSIGDIQLNINLGCDDPTNSGTATVPIYGLNGMVIAGNSILSAPGGAGGSVYYIKEATGSQKNLSQVQSTYPSLAYQNIEVDPLFVSPDATTPDFSPQQGSPVIDKGVFLTKAYPAGSAIRFDDPNYFIDGYGLIPGDQIKFKTSGQVRRIQLIDYDTKSALLDSAITLPAGGDEVALVYNGNAPDIGAVETTYTASPPTTLTNTYFSISPETSVNISNRAFTVSIQSGGSTVFGPTAIIADQNGRIALPSNILSPGSYSVSVSTAKYLSRRQNFSLLSNQTFSFSNKLLTGDINNDGVINSLDWSSMSTVWFTNSPANDLNEDGIVNSLDRALLIRNWFRVGE